jgi:hypothetical protein
MQRSRGRELPGNFNPMLVSQLFWDQSERWGGIARSHVDSVAGICKDFLLQVLDHTIAPELKSRVLDLTVLPALAAAREAAFEELKKIEEDKQRHPITYNHYFTDTLQKSQQDSQEKDLHRIKRLAEESKVAGTFTGGFGTPPLAAISFDTFYEKLGKSTATEKNMDKYSAKQALESHTAYYKVRMSPSSRLGNTNRYSRES